MNYLTVNEAAEVLGLSPARIRSMAATGELMADKLGRDWIFSGAAVERAASTHRPGAGRPATTVDDTTLKNRILREIGRRPGTVSGLAARFDERAVRVRRVLDELVADGIVERQHERGRGQIWTVAPHRGVRLGLRDDLAGG